MYLIGWSRVTEAVTCMNYSHGDIIQEAVTDADIELFF